MTFDDEHFALLAEMREVMAALWGYGTVEAAMRLRALSELSQLDTETLLSVTAAQAEALERRIAA